jgi:hypothetical protein
LSKLHFWMHKWIHNVEKPLENLYYKNLTIPYPNIHMQQFLPEFREKLNRKYGPQKNIERLDYE